MEPEEEEDGSSKELTTTNRIVEFINKTTGANKYTWSFGDGQNDSIVNPTHNYQKSAIDSFEVHLLSKSIKGCSSIFSLWIKETQSLIIDLYIPNGFSPNNDDQNDRWTILGLEKYTNTQIIVFNNWGEIVFDGNSTKNSWDGTYKNELLPTADYYYIIDLGNNQKYNGVVTLKQ